MVMHKDYYDIDCILAEEEKVPVMFEMDAVGLGFLDSTTESENLERDTKVELPLWLAKELSTRGFVSIELPKCFAHRFRTFLVADPVTINLAERCRFYYEVGVQLAGFVRDSRQLVSAMIKSLAMRYQDILDKAQNSRNEDLSELTRTLTFLEQNIFSAGHKGALELYRWKRRECNTLQSFRGHKRRRLA